MTKADILLKLEQYVILYKRLDGLKEVNTTSFNSTTGAQVLEEAEFIIGRMASIYKEIKPFIEDKLNQHKALKEDFERIAFMGVH